MIETQLGWLSRDALIASSRNRLIIRASADRSSFKILTATVRPSAIWSARYTAPLPPIPMQAVSLNLSPRKRPTSLSDLLTWSWTWPLTKPRGPPQVPWVLDDVVAKSRHHRQYRVRRGRPL